MTFLDIEPEVLRWAKERNLLKPGNGHPQYEKLREELGEVVAAKANLEAYERKLGNVQLMNFRKKELIEELHLELGDVLVCFAILLNLYHSSFKQALNSITLFTTRPVPLAAVKDLVDHYKPDTLTKEQVEEIFCLFCWASEAASDYQSVECLQKAYDKIKNRKGKTINGFFIKEGDTLERVSSPQENH